MIFKFFCIHNVTDFVHAEKRTEIRHTFKACSEKEKLIFGKNTVINNWKTNTVKIYLGIIAFIFFMSHIDIYRHFMSHIST